MSERRREFLAALGVFTLLALLYIAPVLGRFSTHAFGSVDTHYNVWLAWWRKYALLNGLDYLFQPVLLAPFGTDQVVPGFSGLFLTMAALAIPFGEVAAYNLMVIVGLVLNPLLLYLIARQWIDNRAACFAGALFFAYSSAGTKFARILLDVHQMWVILLFVLALLHHWRKRSVGSAVGVGAAFALAALFHPYNVQYTALIALIFAAFEIARAEGMPWRRVGLYALSAVVGVVLFLPDLLPILGGLSPADNPIRAGGTLGGINRSWVIWSANRPWNFFIPPEDTLLLGRLTAPLNQWIYFFPYGDFAPPLLDRLAEPLYGLWFWQTLDTEAGPAFLGFVPLVLAAVAVWAKPESDRMPAFWWPFLVTVFIVSLLWSLPPFIPIGAALRYMWEPLHNLVIPMPSALNYYLLPQFRSVDRFIIPMLFCLSLAAAYGLDVLLSRIGRLMWRVALLFGLLLAFAAIHWAPRPLTDLTPLAFADDLPPDSSIVYLGSSKAYTDQRIHQRPMLNIASRPHTPPDRIAYITQIMPADTARAMRTYAALGLTHLIWYDPPPDLPSGLTTVASEDRATLYTITADPIPLIVLQTASGQPYYSAAQWDEAERLVVWNPTPEARPLTLTFAGDLPTAVTPTLTPHPPEIIISGFSTPNPIQPAPYAGPIPIEAATLTLSIKPGETLLTFEGASPTIRVIDE